MKRRKLPEHLRPRMVQALHQAQHTWAIEIPDQAFLPQEIIYAEPEPIPEPKYTKDLEPVADGATPYVEPDEQLEVEEQSLDIGDQPLEIPEDQGKQGDPVIDTTQQQVEGVAYLTPDQKITPDEVKATQERRVKEKARERLEDTGT